MMDASNFFNMATLQITFTVSPAAVAAPPLLEIAAPLLIVLAHLDASRAS